jgi:hypothetical protein
MALFSELPVYKLGYDLLINLYNSTSGYNREYKYTLGEKIKNEATALLINIYSANKSAKQTKPNYIELGRKNIEVLRLLLRISKDLKVLSLKSFVLLNGQVEELSKQLLAWQKYTAGAQNLE